MTDISNRYSSNFETINLNSLLLALQMPMETGKIRKKKKNSFKRLQIFDICVIWLMNEKDD